MTFRVHKAKDDKSWTWTLDRDGPQVSVDADFVSESLARSDVAAFKRSCSGRGIRYAKVVTV